MPWADQKPGEAPRAGGRAPRRGPAETFLPDFCSLRSVFLVVVIGELLAFLVTLARGGVPGRRLDELALVSLYIQWVGLASAALLCLARPYLARCSEPAAAVLAYLGILGVTWAMAEAAWALERSWRGATGLGGTGHGAFLARSLGVSAIVSALALRYFYVQHHWQRQVRAEGEARLQALAARIRPHFLFNCMNTIASLARRRPEEAERAVEDLAELLRASLADGRSQVTLEEELRLCRRYLDIERLRLGERLEVRWETDRLPADARLPALTLQPLIENAVYHGVEPCPGGGRVRISGRRLGQRLDVVIENTLDPAGRGMQREGNRIAQENVRARLQALYGPEGGLAVENEAESYRVTVSFPYRRGDEDSDRR